MDSSIGPNGELTIFEIEAMFYCTLTTNDENGHDRKAVHQSMHLLLSQLLGHQNYVVDLDEQTSYFSENMQMQGAHYHPDKERFDYLYCDSQFDKQLAEKSRQHYQILRPSFLYSKTAQRLLLQALAQDLNPDLKIFSREELIDKTEPAKASIRHLYHSSQGPHKDFVLKVWGTIGSGNVFYTDVPTAEDLIDEVFLSIERPMNSAVTYSFQLDINQFVTLEQCVNRNKHRTVERIAAMPIYSHNFELENILTAHVCSYVLHDKGGKRPYDSHEPQSFYAWEDHLRRETFNLFTKRNFVPYTNHLLSERQLFYLQQHLHPFFAKILAPSCSTLNAVVDKLCWSNEQVKLKLKAMVTTLVQNIRQNFVPQEKFMVISKIVEEARMPGRFISYAQQKFNGYRGKVYHNLLWNIFDEISFEIKHPILSLFITLFESIPFDGEGQHQTNDESWYPQLRTWIILTFKLLFSIKVWQKIEPHRLFAKLLARDVFLQQLTSAIITQYSLNPTHENDTFGWLIPSLPPITKEDENALFKTGDDKLIYNTLFAPHRLSSNIHLPTKVDNLEVIFTALAASQLPDTLVDKLLPVFKISKPAKTHSQDSFIAAFKNKPLQFFKESIFIPWVATLDAMPCGHITLLQFFAIKLEEKTQKEPKETLKIFLTLILAYQEVIIEEMNQELTYIVLAEVIGYIRGGVNLIPNEIMLQSNWKLKIFSDCDYPDLDFNSHNVQLILKKLLLFHVCEYVLAYL